MFYIVKLKFFVLVALLVLFLPISSFAYDGFEPQPLPPQPITEYKEPMFKNPVCLLVGINSNELSYREISNLSGFELFSVPYRSDIHSVVDQIKPSQVIIKHPSGFVGLYTISGQLIRGVQPVAQAESSTILGSIPQSIIQPLEANPTYESIYYPGIESGAIANGGVGYNKQPVGRGNFWRNLLKIVSFGYMVPFQYPVFYNGFPNRSSIAGSLIVPAIPSGISALATYADSKFEAADYNAARSQPRDYKFQPEVEGY